MCGRLCWEACNDFGQLGMVLCKELDNLPRRQVEFGESLGKTRRGLFRVQVVEICCTKVNVTFAGCNDAIYSTSYFMRDSKEGSHRIASCFEPDVFAPQVAILFPTGCKSAFYESALHVGIASTMGRFA